LVIRRIFKPVSQKPDRSGRFKVKKLAAIVAALCVFSTSSAFAWGEAGHELIGAIAQSILEQPGHIKANKEVKRILSLLGTHTLSEAATWADCVRSVVKDKEDNFSVQYHQKQFSAARICQDAFPQDDEQEAKAMTDYVERNWSKCDYVEAKKDSGDCHKSYHFADVPYQHGRYVLGDLSTSDHDVVSTIKEALYFLKHKQPSADTFVVFRTEREALFVLAHMVGDLHQPLHVGSVYLDPKGKVIDPGHDEELAKKSFTKGGNDIYDARSEAAKPPQLHGDWDTIPKSFGVEATAAWVKGALKAASDPATDHVHVSEQIYTEWPVQWASETITVARDKAFKGMTYQHFVLNSDGAGPNKSVWSFNPPDEFNPARADAQELQLKRAAGRLARVLTALWPD
jgi:hypothetical protein